jgi:acetoin utilization deacetylase AcuC-like enzyme
MFAMTILYTDPLFLKHDTGSHHPETSRRLEGVTGRLAKTELSKICVHGTFEPLSEEAVSKVHAPAQVRTVRRFAENGGGHIDADTAVSPDSFHVALGAAGACAAAVDAVIKGPERNALCLVRPPGHHATPTQSMGFCLFNNVALAVDRARRAHGVSRILIVDWDVHHGNGTQDFFWEDPEVVFFSIHRFGHGFYPGTGGQDETGHGKGAGRIFNAPVRFGTSRKEYVARFNNMLEKAADLVKPELVVISAGFDAHALDPIGSLGLEVEDFATLTRQVIEVSKVHAQGRLVSCLEGGYNLQVLPEAVQAHLEELVGG